MLGAMLSSDWGGNACDILRFQNSDKAVKVVVRSMYAGSIESPCKTHKIIKFAMYLQMDKLIKRLIRNNIRSASGALRIKIGMLVDEYDHKMYKLCADYMFWVIGRPQMFVDTGTLYRAAKQIGRRELDWVLGKVDDNTARMLSILYGYLHQDREFAIRAINSMDMQSNTIKMYMKCAALVFPKFPAEYKTLIIEEFAKYPRMVNTCGCMKTFDCKFCGYKYCNHCAAGRCQSRMMCCNNSSYMCPRCQFSSARYDYMCSKCCERSIRAQSIIYCSTCDMMPRKSALHGTGRCVKLDIEGTLLKFREKHADAVRKMHTRIEHLILEAANRMQADVGADVGAIVE